MGSQKKINFAGPIRDANSGPSKLAAAPQRMRSPLRCLYFQNGRPENRLPRRIRTRTLKSSLFAAHIGNFKPFLMQKNNSVRTEARSSKLRSLKPSQIAALKTWLIVEKLTYAQAGARLRERFGVSLALGTLSRFWYTYCQTTRPPRPDRKTPIQLDVLIQSAGPFRVIVRETKVRLRFKAGTMIKRGLNKKHTFFIGPDPEHEAKP